MSEWLLLNANSAIFQLYHGENMLNPMRWWWGPHLTMKDRVEKLRATPNNLLLSRSWCSHQQKVNTTRKYNNVQWKVIWHPLKKSRHQPRTRVNHRNWTTCFLGIEWLLFNAYSPIFHLLYIMEKTSWFSMRWWWGPLCSRPTHWVGFL